MPLAHDHAHDASRGSERRLFWAALLTGTFMLAEVAGGLFAGSLALIADAGHMLTDTVSLAFAWAAARLSTRPPDEARTFGYHRLQILVAFANGIALAFIIAWIAIEAVARILQPVEVLGGAMLGVAIAGLAVNIAAFLVLHGAARTSLNVRGALLHVMGDLLGSLAALLAALVILATGWSPIDPILSLVVALLLARSAVMLIRESGHILLEGTPRALDIGAIKRDLAASVPGVAGVHHVHVWSLSEARPMITLHVRPQAAADAERLKAGIRRRLAERFGIAHATIEVERAEGARAPSSDAAAQSS